MAGYINRGIAGLQAHLKDGHGPKVDINSWVGNMVMDIHSQLTMSHEAAAVELGSVLHPVVSRMHSAVTTIQYCTQLQYLPTLLTWLPKMLPSKDVFTVLGGIPPLGPAITERLAEKDIQRNDFVSHMLADHTIGGSDVATVRKNALIFILSGVETIPGYSCSALYYLLAEPSYFQTVSQEVRSKFARSEDITLGAVQALPFLNAVMREVLRVSPPAVGTLPRRVPSGGAIVCNQFVPGGTTIGIHNWSATHSNLFWTDPYEFRPERWLGGEKYANDNRESFHPFGHGPRTCVARHLVFLEATLIVAKLVFAFDMSLDRKDCGEWPVHRGHFVPTRDSLFIDVCTSSA